MSLRREAPWLLALPAGLGLLVAAGAWDTGVGMRGYGWPGYVRNAWAYAAGQTGQLDVLRGTLHGAALGHLGELLGSYSAAAITIASASATLLLVSTALIARLLGGPWAGALAALTLPLAPRVATSAQWANSYPLLSAMGAAAVAAALLAARRPGLLPALAAGALMGAAHAADSRAILLAPTVLVLVAVGVWRGRGPTRWLLLPLVIGGALVGPTIDRALAPHRRPSPNWQGKLRLQRPVVERWVRVTRDEALLRDCRDVPRAGFLTPWFLTTPCAHAVFSENVRRRLVGHVPLGVGALLLSLVLARPGRRRFEGVVVLVTWGGVVVMQCALTPMPDRYLLQHAAALSALPAAGLLRLSLSPRRWGGMGVAAAAALWVWRGDPAGRGAFDSDRSGYAQYQRDAAAVLSAVGGSGFLLDCGDRFIELSALPRRLHRGPPTLRADDAAERCLNWIDRAEKATWVVIDPRRSLKVNQPRSSRRREVALEDLLSRSAAWSLELDTLDYQLWRRR